MKTHRITTGIVLLLVLSSGVIAIPRAKAVKSRRKKPAEIVLAMSQFKISFDKTGKKQYTPGDAKVWVLRPDRNWERTELTDSGSNVVHKALPYDVDGDGQNELVVVGGSKASIKFHRLVNGRWEAESIWEPDLLRVRDIEFGDVDADGQTEFVVATHDRGGVYVFDCIDGKWTPTQVYGTEDRQYVHEVEIGDVDGDGVQEFFANPSAPNVDVGIAQPGKVVMFKWNGKSYDHTVVEDMAETHAKEMLVADLYGTGRPVLLVPIEGTGRKKEDGHIDIATPTQVTEYRWVGGKTKRKVIAEIPDLQVRSLWAGDADNDGVVDIVAGAKLAGLFIIKRRGNTWASSLIDADSCSAVHAVFVGDVDGDGSNEILSSADFFGRLDLYRHQRGQWEKQTVLDLPQGDWVWTIYQGDVDRQ